MAAPKKAAEEKVYAGPPAEDPTPTVAVGDPAPENANLTGSGPDKSEVKTVDLKSPWGSRVTVDAETAKELKEHGYK